VREAFIVGRRLFIEGGGGGGGLRELANYGNLKTNMNLQDS
jgi:hypothetical protein